MDGEAKMRGPRSRRRERAARMQKQALRCQSGDDGDESPGRAKPQRPPNRKKRNKEPIFEEDVIDGFAILSFRTYDDLESTMKRQEPETRPSSPEPVLNNRINCNDKNSPESPTPRKNKNNRGCLGKVRKGSRVSSEQSFPEVPPVNRTPRSTSRDRLSDGSTRSSSGRGYMCDSESESERASDAGSDLFSGPQHNPRRPPSLKTTSSPAAQCVTNACSSPSSRGPPSPVANGPSWPLEPQAPAAVALTATSSAPPITTSAPSSPSASAAALVVSGSQRPEPRRPTPDPPQVPPPSTQPSIVSELLSQPPFLPTDALNGSNSNCSIARDFSRTQPISSSSADFGRTPISSAGADSNRTPIPSSAPVVTTSSGVSLRNGSLFTNSSSPSPLLASHLVHTTNCGSAGSSVSKPVTPAAGAPAPAPLFPFSLSRASPPQGYLATSSSQTTQPTTPTPSLGSSHSNSSLSSLSQLSQSLQVKEGGRSSSRNNTPALGSLGTATTPCCAAASFPGGTTNSLTSLVFSKPWVSPSANSYVASANGPHLTPPVHHRPTPPPPLPTSLPSNHPFSSHPQLHPMFAPPPMPPPAPSLASPNIGLSSGPAGFVAETPLLPSKYHFRDRDLLRELDTRFLASQDRSINIPPPPYMRTELHQHHHQHQHMHQHSPFLPPSLGGSLVPPGAQHIYDKFHPKLDSPFYPRNALGLPGYTGLSPLLNPGVSNATPFVAPGHLAAFQPKMNPLVKNKTMKSGRWCAMHVRIAWEIYNHQQKQQVDGHKPGGMGGVAPPTLPGKNDLLRPPNHLYSSLPRPHDLSPFPSALLGAAGASSHTRPHFDTSPHGNFLTPNPSHIGMTRLPSTSSSSLNRTASSRVLPPGMSPFARPGYPGFGVASANSYGSLGGLGLSGGGLFPSRDLGALAGASVGQDPWSRLHRSSSFPGPMGVQGAAPPERTSGSAWGGLKAEAERERLDHENEKQRKLAEEKERKEREAALEKAKELEREKKAHEERQRERDRENRLHMHHLSDGLMRNGDYYDGRNPIREPHREWSQPRERPRSPMRLSRDPKTENTFDGSLPPSKPEVRVKEERRDEDSHCAPLPRDPPKKSLEHMPRSENELRNLQSLDRAGGAAHLLGSVGGLPPNMAADRAFWGAPLAAPPGVAGVPGDPYRLLDLHSVRDLEQRYRLLGPMMPLHDRFREGPSELERLALERELQSKLAPPPLRPADPSSFAAQALFNPLPPPNSYLNSLTGLAARNKNGSPAAAATPGGGVPPPLIPCSSGAANHSRLTPPVHHKISSLVEHNDTGVLYAKDRRELSNHKSAADAQMR
ncbi:autism susceptibility gene 2 protein-like isoform X2 [Ornithodoros turicata]|uniref:autism susceptibility gene 2 protein-like isoform X2 n=1 Tax=Ornithodoros turicata TaxID=34597 RepID=UPI003139E6FF